MSELRVNMVMSLDGYTAGPQQSAENPFDRSSRAGSRTSARP